LNFCRGSAPWQRLVQSGFYEVALTLLFPGTVVPCDLTEPSRFWKGEHETKIRVHEAYLKRRRKRNCWK
jgi:hypothetical protein